MSVITPNETTGSWRTHKREAAVRLYLTGAEGDTAALVGVRAGWSAGPRPGSRWS